MIAMSVVKILVIWFIVSIPVALLLGRLLHNEKD